MAAINYFSQDISFTFSNRRKVSAWIKKAIRTEGKVLTELNFIFCSDEYLLKINTKFLNHKTYTDIITFDNSDRGAEIAGDIFISVERVKENALKLKIPFSDELHRVVIHGVLHLIGYSDKTARQKKEMRKKEDAYLSLR